jgi:serine/threonine-protein kinase
MTLERLRASLTDRYSIERELGAGGMATVYLAHDVRHDRKVALKVLRPELSAILGAERFLAEIKTTANLQHPHILSLFDSGEADGLVFYVMPYVEGESLRDRLTREKQLPVDEAVRIAREVADALDYAHGHGVIHRDIKPENILLHGGHALVADFGIALAASRSEGGSRMTETGMSLGTPHYMAPEQAMGEREITPKADIYALGCVLYEMLTAEPPFVGATAQAIIARVMTEEPRSLTLQRKTIPPHVEAAVVTALAKLPADRFATARAFAEALSEAGAQTHARVAARRVGTAPPARSPRERLRAAAPWAAAVLMLVIGLTTGARFLGRAAPPRPLRLSVAVPTESPPLAVRLSPDGSTLAYVSGQGDRLALYTRRLDELRPRRLDGTEDGFTISYSPDGQTIAFLGGSGPRKVPSTGGASVAIPVQGGAALTALEFAGPDRFVVGTQGALATLAADGTMHWFAGPDSAGTEPALVLDQVLPDGWVLARSWRAPPNGPIQAIDPGSGRSVTLLDVNAAWSGYADGVLAWTLPDGTLYAASCDLAAKRLTGPGKPVGATVLAVLGFLPPVSIGQGGIAYVPTRPRALVQVARSGLSTVLLGTDRTYHNPRVSPDGRRISLDFTEQERDVWLFDIADSTLTRFGFDSSAHDAEWLPDGSGLLFAAVRGGAIGEFRRRFEARGPADSVFVGPEQISVHAVTRDLRTGIAVLIERGAFDLVAIGLDGRGRLDSLLTSRYNEGWPALSPDGRWLAYQSDESGRFEVYIRAWPALGSKVQVSQNGGSEPTWSRDGRELFYRSGGGAEPFLMAAAIEAGPSLRVRSRTPLFSVASYEFATPHRDYDVFPDGRSFVLVRQGQPGQQAEVVYLQNVMALLEGR